MPKLVSQIHEEESIADAQRCEVEHMLLQVTTISVKLVAKYARIRKVQEEHMKRREAYAPRVVAMHQDANEIWQRRECAPNAAPLCQLEELSLLGVSDTPMR